MLKGKKGHDRNESEVRGARRGGCDFGVGWTAKASVRREHLSISLQGLKAWVPPAALGEERPRRKQPARCCGLRAYRWQLAVCFQGFDRSRYWIQEFGGVEGMQEVKPAGPRLLPKEHPSGRSKSHRARAGRGRGTGNAVGGLCLVGLSRRPNASVKEASCKRSRAGDSVY